MTTSERRVLELALLGIESERRRLDDELDDIRRRLGRSTSTLVTHNQKRVVPPQQTGPSNRRKMTVAQRRKISQAMKARWAGLKRAKAA
jgi:hypothetical protein